MPFLFSGSLFHPFTIRDIELILIKRVSVMEFCFLRPHMFSSFLSAEWVTLITTEVLFIQMSRPFSPNTADNRDGEGVPTFQKDGVFLPAVPPSRQRVIPHTKGNQSLFNITL